MRTDKTMYKIKSGVTRIRDYENKDTPNDSTWAYK